MIRRPTSGLQNRRGVAQISVRSTGLSLHGPNSILSRSLVIHADPDDLGMGGVPASATTGNSGGRVACGVIGIVDPTRKFTLPFNFDFSQFDFWSFRAYCPAPCSWLNWFIKSGVFLNVLLAAFSEFLLTFNFDFKWLLIIPVLVLRISRLIDPKSVYFEVPFLTFSGIFINMVPFPAPCADADQNCAAEVGNCMNPANEKDLIRRCRKTCGHCDCRDMDRGCAQLKNLCTSPNAQNVRDQCRLTCELCNCNDQAKDCSQHKALCDDPVFGPEISRQCRQTCRKCWNSYFS